MTSRVTGTGSQYFHHSLC